MSTTERKEWRRRFIQEIAALTGGEENILELAIWSLDAQAMHGDGNPEEVAQEAFKKGKPPLDWVPSR
jgi:hypothetical protein